MNSLLPVVDASDAGRRRRRAIDADTLRTAKAILDDLDARGDAAALEHARRFGDLDAGGPVMFTREMLAAACEAVPDAARLLLDRTCERVRGFAIAQRECLGDLSVPIPGGEAGHTCVPVETAGCYAPGGKFPLPSSVIMTVVTARVAGVERVWVASPRPTGATLAAAFLAGADGLLAIGGVQGIGALAKGLLGVTPGGCDVIVGPGNRWVTAAKQLVSGEVGIDMLAGPSELLILADGGADPRLIAADLLAQAEHDEDAVPMVVTTSRDAVAGINRELELQLATLPTASIARAALRNGFVAVASTLDEAIALANRVGPEHLEIMAEDAARIARHIRNAGAVFIGAGSAEVLGDYGIGPNHVLPTGGTSRFRAGLSVFTFLRARTWLRVDRAEMAGAALEDAAALARLEGLEGHARAAELRRNVHCSPIAGR